MASIAKKCELECSMEEQIEYGRNEKQSEQVMQELSVEEEDIKIWNQGKGKSYSERKVVQREEGGSKCDPEEGKCEDQVSQPIRMRATPF